MRDILGVLIVLFGAMFAIFSPILGVAYLVDKSSCASQAARMGFPREYGLIEGCMVEYKPGSWIPLEQFSAADVSLRK